MTVALFRDGSHIMKGNCFRSELIPVCCFCRTFCGDDDCDGGDDGDDDGNDSIMVMTLKLIKYNT